MPSQFLAPAYVESIFWQKKPQQLTCFAIISNLKRDVPYLAKHSCLWTSCLADHYVAGDSQESLFGDVANSKIWKYSSDWTKAHAVWNLDPFWNDIFKIGKYESLYL